MRSRHTALLSNICTTVQILHETIHHKMYEIATSKYNPFSVGGSESIQDLGGGSEKIIDR